MKDHIVQKLQQSLEELGYPTELATLSQPNEPDHGDYSTPVALALAKQEKKNPMEIAEKIAGLIETDDIIGKVEVLKPGFINFWVNTSQLLEILASITQSSTYGTSHKNKGKKVIVEYSSPNIAKPFTVGHLRSTIIGDSIANLLEATGYTVFRDSHVGDWGTQFGKLIYAIKTWGKIEDIEKSDRPVKELVELYVKFHDEAEKDKTLDDEGRKWFKKLEDGDSEARELWQKCIDWSWKEFDVIYQKLGVEFTENNGRGFGESYFEGKMQPVVEELKQKLGSKELYKESKGANLVFFPGETLPPFMIMKQDGSTLYSTRDLATDKFRLEKYGSDVTIINEVGIEQSLYFEQLYETERMLGWIKEGQRIHVKHGLYRFKDTKMSTRKGNTIWLEDVLEEAFNKSFLLTGKSGKLRAQFDLNESQALEIMDRHENLNSKASHSDMWKIAIGALKWNDLKRSSHLDIVFDWDEILAMDGNSGPYMQYTFVRCMSVLEKEQPSLDENWILRSAEDNTISEEEMRILRHIAHFPEVIASAAQNFAPNYICTYLFELAQQYNYFYQKHPILKAENDEKNLRLTITKATAQVIQQGLTLLGIQTVEKM